MGIEENKKTLQRYFDELHNQQDYSKADEILHEDYTGSGGGIKGVEGLKQFIKQQHSQSSDLTYKTMDMIAEEDRIAIFLEVSGIHDGVFNGVPPTGNTFSIAQVSVYEFRDGKVYRGLSRTLLDQLGLYQQLGVLPSTAEFVQAYNDSLK